MLDKNKYFTNIALNPFQVFRNIARYGMSTEGHTVKYDESLQAKNRDACKLIAEHYNNSLVGTDKKGRFVFISAAKRVIPLL